MGILHGGAMATARAPASDEDQEITIPRSR